MSSRFIKYVSFTEAKKLKENGFDGNVHSMYDENGVIFPFCGNSSNSKVKVTYPNEIYYARPEYESVDVWLKKNSIYIVVTPYQDKYSDFIHVRFSVTIFGVAYDEDEDPSTLVELFNDYGFTEHETAYEFAIGYSIQNFNKFIKTMKEKENE